ncbi:Uncharacterised protein [[Clostridium] sordellii]|uniref:DUF4325 domain-containing protein n=1 Tax=Paraclostridium sordellii TaxID=1505 RepID=A0ABM9RTM2_PARSO|nr:hypothetical protein [Paeniclostridium sordellii]EPZ62118.1 hypothetical protein H477_5693 [[Clostridium] sordellii ATCC 9714] [Paeniclostridium sordellii ATCC 9714]CEJ75417.1 hypothetical protein ATCC9714_PCS200101 (plasmid) [[Clostridium] sordellii] [Paeniclostridium sordellii]CEN68009.1 Uncharacterised protein [[Clostridium] sordellii] [Paeniclostridium sordellii]CEN71300.1 Uncharacterised protein [[Clostridium] sordellii] [Paeniclostridium sordellii]CEO20860.1 Uncharacterised protein [[
MKIQLQFNNTITRLAGNSFGKKIYENQVKNKINLEELNIIEFPNTIEDLAISFVQGFTEDIFKSIKKDEFSKYFSIEGNQKVIDKFEKSIYF